MQRRVFSKEKQTLNKKLFAYMFLMAAMLLALFIIGIFLVGGYTGVEKEISDTLQFQTQVFARQVKTHYDGLAVMGVQLSENAAEIIEDYLADSGIEFEELNDSEENIAGVQELLIEQLKGKLVEADSAGVFIMLNVQVNTGVDNAQSSRSGIYLQKNSLDSSDTRILLYRGLAKTERTMGRCLTGSGGWSSIQAYFPTTASLLRSQTSR